MPVHIRTPPPPKLSEKDKSLVPIGVILGLYGGLYGDNGKENGNYYNGLYRVWSAGEAGYATYPTNMPVSSLKEPYASWPTVIHHNDCRKTASTKMAAFCKPPVRSDSPASAIHMLSRCGRRYGDFRLGSGV